MQLRRDSKRSEVHFRDDLSEYSSPSNWGERPGPLYFGDHRLTTEGLQARRTVGEAILKAEWERRRDLAEVCADKCACLNLRTPRMHFEAFGFRPLHKLVFAWADVQSIILLPFEERGPYLLCVTTFRLREDGSREWMLQAASLRGRARWAIDMMAAILRERSNTPQHGCCSSNRDRGPLSLSLFMDMARIACEVARLQPSVGGLERLIEALDLLAGGRRPAQNALTSPRLGASGRRPSSVDIAGIGARVHSASAEAALMPAPHFPLAALRRFGDAARRAAADFAEWRRWRELCLLIRPPRGVDIDFWQSYVLPYLCPREPSLRDTTNQVYPVSIDHQLASAAERWRRTLS
eukprot:TRINITY_DN50606_c0_g1_i1.p1 TRINITY_DN50606_c0_g1~~TRINITY_DN50606_c0_g1_i1.p1  ORF type:complete len:351 (+),score=29.69 TRINITY_DN50606_c0_g1_i1:83-1135(+)